jgi:hypothetical protein
MRAACVVGLLLSLCALGSSAFAASTSSEKLCTNVGDTCFQELAVAITSTFPFLDSTSTNPTPATAGADWCFEVENDPTTNWWYFTHNGYTYAHSSDGGVRIKLTYQLPSTGAIGFASIFLAVDLLKHDDYENLTKNTQVTGVAVDGGSPVKFPDPSNPPTFSNPCPGVEEFVKGAFPKYLGSWVLIDEPNCVGVECGTSPIGPPDPNNNNTPTPVSNVLISETNVENPLYWRFNNTTHTIAGALRFIIMFTSGPYNGQYGVFWLGYGGSGPGG